MMMAKVSQSDLKALADLMQSGTVRTVIDRTYPLDEVREAVRYLETGRARGKVIVTVAPEIVGRLCQTPSLETRRLTETAYN
jgi:D-arabinose 1-dehydrogenase-like Zn-dependent alcohol dehydrogenase